MGLMGPFFLEPLTLSAPEEVLLSAITTAGIPATLNFKCQDKLPRIGFVNTDSLSVWS